MILENRSDGGLSGGRSAAPLPPPSSAGPPERRRVERRVEGRIADLSLPEFRRMLVTTTVFVVVSGLFVWMVRTVLIAAIVGVVITVFVRPAFDWLESRVGGRTPAALLTLTGLLVPLIAVMMYSYLEIRSVVEYLVTHQAEVIAEISRALHRLPFVQGDVQGTVREGVLTTARYGEELPGELSEALAGLSVAMAVFLFTAFYVLTERESIVAYVRSKVPPRYTELASAIETNTRGVLYGAVYATLVTQTIKSSVILGLNLIFGVPLAVVLAIVSFVIGFFPIVGSWTVYVPVAAWLLIFRDAVGPALLMLAVGFFANTLFFSMYLRPKLAADRSRVLNFYWMFVGLVTGVYTFGIAGILLGPILIGMLKAILDIITAARRWRFDDQPAEEASGIVG